MFIVPLGLVSKTKNIPIATIVLCAVTVFFSIIKFPENKVIEEVLLRSPERVEFGQQAKEYLLKKCPNEQPEALCKKLGQTPMTLFSHGYRRKSLSKKSLAGLYIYENLQPEKLRKSNPKLYKQQKIAEQEVTRSIKSLNHLSNKTITPVSVVKTIFTHAGWLHLFGNILIFIFLAFPVEERMGSFLFALTYLVSGMAGSLLQAYLSPESVYILGASSSVSGIAGALTYFFWNHRAKVWVSYFFIFSQVVAIPVFIYTPVFMVAGDLLGLFDQSTNVAHFAHLGGFGAGVLMSFFHSQLLPLPKNFSYPFELDFLNESKHSLSQLNRLKVFSKWLYYTPINLYAFKHFVAETSRSELNPKAQLIIDHFKKNIFPEVYEANKNKVTFVNILPVDWLHLLGLGDDPAFLKKTALKFEEQRDFVNAFKLYFILLNEVGWNNKEYGQLLYKNYKKSTISEKFVSSSQALAFSHPPFRSFLERNGDNLVSNAS